MTRPSSKVSVDFAQRWWSGVLWLRRSASYHLPFSLGVLGLLVTSNTGRL